MGVARRKSKGARRLGIGVMTGALAVGLIASLGTIEAASAHVSGIVRSTAPAPATEPAQARTAGSEALRVMPLGDSITRGAGSPSGNSYRLALAERLREGGMEINYVGSMSNGAGADTEHEGHGGWTIDQLSAELDRWLTDARPDVVLLHVGTNDITQGAGPYTTARRLTTMIDQIRAARPAAQIFVAQIISSRVPGELAQDRIYNRLIPVLVAARNDPLIRVVNQASIAGLDLHSVHHPNDFGYAKMAWNWYRAMAQVFPAGGGTGANPYATQSTRLCLAVKDVRGGRVHRRTECRIWTLRTVTAKINGVNRRVRIWQTPWTVKQTYRVRVGSKVETRTRLVHKWVGTGNLSDGQ